MMMLRIIFPLDIAFLLVVLFCGSCWATEVKTTEEPVDFVLPLPRSGLEFQVDQNFSLSSLEGSMISWKRLSSADRGWRLGISPVVFSEERFDPFSSGSYEYHSDRYVLGFSIQRLWLGKFRERTRVYWGTGPLFEVSYLENTQITHYDDGRPDYRRKNIDRSFRVGASVILGVEYYFLDSMSLMAEYRFEANYVETFETADEVENSYFDFSPRPVRLGLSVLF